MNRLKVVDIMDKITRVLLLYSKLIRGEPVNKISFCMETDSNERSFDRDIEDVRLYLSESFSTDELVYDRLRKSYFLTGVAKQDLEMTEYRFLEQLLIKSELLRKDELAGLLSILASNSTRPRECLNKISIRIKDYPIDANLPLLKMHDDLMAMINSNAIIVIKYYENNGSVNEYKIFPYDIQFTTGKIYLVALDSDSESVYFEYYLLERIESFVKIGSFTDDKKNKIEGRLKKNIPAHTQDILIEIECTDTFQELLKMQYKGSVNTLDESRVSVLCDKEKFVRWILGQDVSDYEIISPIDVNEEIRKRARNLYRKYRKE